MCSKYSLYRTPDPQGNSDECVRIATGSLEMLNTLAKKKGWKWRKDSSLFGGYWVDIQTGDSYMYDVPGEAKEVK